MRVARVAHAAAFLAAAFAGACDQPEMRDQPKLETYEAAAGFPRDMAARHPPAGTLAREDPIDPVPPQPDVDAGLLARGRVVYEAICTPCHGKLGDGRGMVVQRGFPAPPTFHQPRLRAAEDAHFYDVIRDGYGIMYAYADRVAPADRWAVIGYIRALQLSQHAAVAELPAALRRALAAAGEEGS